MIYLIAQLGQLLLTALDIYSILLVVYFLMSWLPGAYDSTLGQILTKICEPYVGFFRRFVPPIGFISIAGLVALFSLRLIETGLITIINFLIRLLA